MSLYGALYSGVSGLKSQSSKIGIISDNISNVNTVGYKAGSGIFRSLVTTASLNSAYSPGGVLSNTRQLVSKQGLLVATDSATDIAISGNGFFVVNSQNDSGGSVLYTRAGSFRPDATGNFVNAAGYFLQAWPLDREGRIPGAAGNTTFTTPSADLNSLQTVNVQALTGSASGTTGISLGANLKATQSVLPGAGATVVFDSTDANNSGISADDMIIPGGPNGIQRGDKFFITAGGTAVPFRYAGFTFSRSVLTSAAGDSGRNRADAIRTLDSTPFAVNGSPTASNVVTVTMQNHGLHDGDVVTISGNTGTVGTIPAGELNGRFVVQNVTGDTFDIVTSTSSTTDSAAGGDGGGTITVGVRPFSGNILDASSASQAFLALTGTAGFTTDALTFTINTSTTGTLTFTYTNTQPSAGQRQFNTLNNLADAINTVDGLTARVSGGRLYVSSEDANEAVTFANGSTQGTVSGTTVKSGIDWVRELGLADVQAASTNDRFNTLNGLAALVNNTDGMSATVNSPTGASTLKIFADNPLGTITFDDPAVSSVLSAYTNSQPFSMTANSSVVTINSPSIITNTFSTGDMVDIDPSGLAGYNVKPSVAESGVVTNTTGGTENQVTITVGAAHGFTAGQVIHIDASSLSNYPNGFINGIPLTSFDGNFTVTAVGATTITITVDTNATAAGASAGSGTLSICSTLGGIPVTALDGTFPITVSGPTTFTINTGIAATTTTSTGGTGLLVTPHNNQGSLLGEFGFGGAGGITSLAGGGYTQQTSGAIGPAYDPTALNQSIASGGIAAHFKRTIQVFDALGTSHNLSIGFVKTGVNSWGAEVYAVPASDVTTALPSGLLAFGTIDFNGDGTLFQVSSALSDPIAITWTNGSDPSNITIDWGTSNDNDGITQYSSNYNVSFATQNGAPVGDLTGVSIDDKGFVVANFSNGQTQRIFKIPIANFSNPDELQGVSGNVYQQTSDSGEVNLHESGTSGAGKIASSSLESSNAELADQLTDMIVAQRAYQANTKVITTADQLLDELNRAIG